MVKFQKELPEPRHFSNAVGNSTIFFLGAGPRDSGLSLGGPTKRQDYHRGRQHNQRWSGSVGAAGPVCVSIDNKLTGDRLGDGKAKADRALEVLENPLGSNKVSFPGIMHMQTELLDSIGNVRLGEC
jgi:hypothetical protein